MLPRIVEARYIAGSKIWIRFSDGAEGDVDLSDELTAPMLHHCAMSKSLSASVSIPNCARWSGPTAQTSLQNSFAKCSGWSATSRAALRPAATTGKLTDMARPLAKIEEEIRELGVADNETLLRVLWEELDGPADSEVDAAWLREAQRRGREIDDGVVERIPAEQVFARLEALTKK